MKYKLINYCEIDKFASLSYSRIHNVDESFNLWDITKIDCDKLEDFDLLVGGSPCQSFSVAGKTEGARYKCTQCGYEYNPLKIKYTKRKECPKCKSRELEGTTSSLIINYLEVINKKRPKMAIFENVKNLIGTKFKETFELFIKEIEEYGYNTYYKVLNAKNYGIPQNRERVIVVIIKKEIDNGEFKFPLPKYSNKNLKDFLVNYNNEIDRNKFLKYYLEKSKVEKIIKNLNKEEYQKLLLHIEDINNGEEINEINLKYDKDKCFEINKEKDILKEDIVIKNYNKQNIENIKEILNIKIKEKNITIKELSQNLKIKEDIIKNWIKNSSEKEIPNIENWNKLKKILEIEQDDNINNFDRFINEYSKKQTDIQSKYFINYICCEIRTDGTNFYKNNNCGTLRTIDGCGNKYIIEIISKKIKNKNIPKYIFIRKIMPIECYRLMGFEDKDFDKNQFIGNKSLSKEIDNYVKRNNLITDGYLLSDTKLYKQAGNSIVIDVLLEIYKEIYKVMPYLFEDLRVFSIFSGIGAFEKALDLL